MDISARAGSIIDRRMGKRETHRDRERRERWVERKEREDEKRGERDSETIHTPNLFFVHNQYHKQINTNNLISFILIQGCSTNVDLNIVICYMIKSLIKYENNNECY